MADSNKEETPAAAPSDDKPTEDTSAPEENAQTPAEETPAAEESNETSSESASKPADDSAAEEKPAADEKPAEDKAAEEAPPADESEKKTEESGDKPADEESKDKPAEEAAATNGDAAPVENGEAEAEKEKTDEEKKPEANGDVEEEKGPFSGTFVHVKSDKLDAYLTAAGLNWLKRQAASKFSPSMDIVQKGEEFKVKTKTAFFTKCASFKLGEEYTDKDINSHAVKVIATLEDGKLVQTVEPAVEGKGKSCKITREIKDNELTMTMEMGDVVCTRHFKKKK